MSLENRYENHLKITVKVIQRSNYGRKGMEAAAKYEICITVFTMKVMVLGMEDFCKGEHHEKSIMCRNIYIIDGDKVNRIRFVIWCH